jgi:hypothetical protein
VGELEGASSFDQQTEHVEAAGASRGGARGGSSPFEQQTEHVEAVGSTTGVGEAIDRGSGCVPKGLGQEAQGARGGARRGQSLFTPLFALATSVVFLTACSSPDARDPIARGPASDDASPRETTVDASVPGVDGAPLDARPLGVDAAPLDAATSGLTKTPTVVDVCAGGYDCGAAGELHLHSDGLRCILSGINIVDIVLCADGTATSSAGGTDGAMWGTWQGDAIAFVVDVASATSGAHMGGARTPSELSLRCVWSTDK